MLARPAWLCEWILLRSVVAWALAILLTVLSFSTPAASIVLKARALPPVWLTLLQAALALPATLCLVYMLRPLPPTPGWRYSRQPLSSLQDAQIITVDTSLLISGRRIVSIALPFEPKAALRKHPRSLSLSTAMAYTIDQANPEDRKSLLEAVSAMGLNRSMLLRYHPVTEESQLDMLTGAVVDQRDRRMTWYTGDVNVLAGLCQGIQDGHARPITEEDRTRLHDGMMALARQGCRVFGYAVADDGAELTGPIFLGMAAMADELIPEAVEACEALLKEGVTLQTQPIDNQALPPIHLAALRSRLKLHGAPYAPHVIISTKPTDTAAISLFPTDHRHYNFDRPLLLAREWFSMLEQRLQLTLGCLLPLLLACLIGPVEPLCVLAACLMLVPGVVLAEKLTMNNLQVILPCALAVAVRVVVQIAVPGMAGDVMALFVLIAALVRSLSLCTRWQMAVTALGSGLIFLALAVVVAALASGASLLAMAFPFLGGLLAGWLMAWPF